MFDENLDIMLAMQDDDFAQILENDEVLIQLEKEKFNSQDEYLELFYIFSGKLKFYDLELNVLTLGMWCFLYSIKNAFTTGKEPQKRDVDIFLYLLANNYNGISQNLYEQSLNYCELNNIPYEEAEFEILKMISICFRPLQMLPDTHENNERNRFNVDWLTSIISVVCKMTNCHKDEVLYKMNLNECFYYVIQNLRQNDYKAQIRRRNSEQINALIYERTFELGKIYYNTKYKDRL